MYVCLYIYIYIGTYLLIDLSTYLCTSLPAYIRAYLLICLSIYLSIVLSICTTSYMHDVHPNTCSTEILARNGPGRDVPPLGFQAVLGHIRPERRAYSR